MWQEINQQKTNTILHFSFYLCYNRSMKEVVFNIDSSRLYFPKLWTGFAEPNMGINISPRRIEEFEIVYIEEGEGELFFPSVSFKYSKGSMLLIPPFVEHSFVSSKYTPHYFAHFMPHNEGVDEYRKIAKKAERGAVIRISSPEVYSMRLLTKDFPMDCIILFKQMLNISNNPKIESVGLSSMRLRCVFLKLFILFCAANMKSGIKTLPLSVSVNYIESHLFESISVSTLAEMEGISVNYYSSEFKKHFGLSPVSFINIKRLSVAKEMLRNESLSVEEIAVKCGFNYTHYFGKMFKRYESCTPTEYRKRILASD